MGVLRFWWKWDEDERWKNTILVLTSGHIRAPIRIFWAVTRRCVRPARVTNKSEKVKMGMSHAETPHVDPSWLHERWRGADGTWRFRWPHRHHQNCTFCYPSVNGLWREHGSKLSCLHGEVIRHWYIAQHYRACMWYKRVLLNRSFSKMW